MANEIRVLALNNDYDYAKFYSEDQVIDMMTTAEFIKFLAQGHTVNYNVRSVYICDMPENDLFERAFEYMDSNCKTPTMNYHSAFDILWSISSEDIYI